MKKDKIDFGWRSEEERMSWYVKVPPKKKMEWLQAMHDFLVATATPKRRRIFWKLRGIK